MCNIAGYIGEKNAAPILLEMIRKQEIFDGGRSTGIATVHNGKLYTRKVIGNADTLIRETDALSLPGKIGIIHSRPTGDHVEFAHPFLADGDTLAMVMNGTLRDVKHLYEKRLSMVEMLDKEGYKLSSRKKVGKSAYTVLSTGEAVTTADAGANYVEYLVKCGKSFPEAMAQMTNDMYGDIVSVMLSSKKEDSIYTCKISRPMQVLLGQNETFMATTAFAFPEEYKNDEIITLPTMHCCRIFKGGFEVTPYKVKYEKTAPVTAEVYKKAYDRIENLLTEKECCYDDVENYIYFDCKDIWCKKHTVVQCAPVAYEVLYDFWRAGRLKTKIKPADGRNLIYMHLD